MPEFKKMFEEEGYSSEVFTVDETGSPSTSRSPRFRLNVKWALSQIKLHLLVYSYIYNRVHIVYIAMHIVGWRKTKERVSWNENGSA
jgi:hypothetical protein